MHRFLIVLGLVIPACAPSAANTASTAPASRGHMSSTAFEDEHRVTHPQSDLTCKDEVPTGTNLERRKCRSQAQRDQEKQAVDDLFLDPTSRPKIRKD